MKCMLDSIFTFIKDILAPKKCYSCKKEWHFLCDKCFNNLDNFEEFCYICKKNSQNFSIHKKCLIENKLLHWSNFNNQKVYFNSVVVLSHYKNKIIKKLIQNFKYFWRKSIGRELAIRCAQLLEKNIDLIDRDNFLLIPVPLHFFRKIQRGFNQTEVLAQSVASELGIWYNKTIVKRKKYTRQQAKLSQEKRVMNIENAFRIDKKHRDKVDKKTIILVDDVISTGTTVNELAKILKQNWAQKIIVLCLASN